MDDEHLNRYGLYPARYCRSTGLPMYNSGSYQAVADVLLSKSRCLKIKRPVQPEEKPVAFYLCQNGYCGLYRRE